MRLAPRQNGQPQRDWLRGEGGGARCERRAEGKLPMTGRFGRRSRRKLAIHSCRTLNPRQKLCAVEQRNADGCDEKCLVLLREIMGRCQSAARLVAVAWAGNGLGMLLRAAILFVEQTGRINNAARNRWQPNERQHQRDRCLDTLHGERDSTPQSVAQQNNTRLCLHDLPGNLIWPAAW